MKSINEIISEIRTNAENKIIEKIWDRVAQINSALDDAYGSALGEHYGSTLNCAAEAVDSYMELIKLCKETIEHPLREHLRDALGSVNWEKFELPADMMAAIQKARNEAANPGKIQITRMPANYYITEDPVEQVGLWCNKITKLLKEDFDEDVPWNQKYNKPTINMNDLEEYLK